MPLPMRSLRRAALVALMGGAAAWYFGWPAGTPDAGVAVAIGGAVMSASATMLGFVLAGLAILASISGSHLVQTMHKTGHFADLLGSLLVGCGLFAACAALGLAIVLGLPASSTVLQVMAALHFGAAVALYEIVTRFALVLSNLRPPSGVDGD